MVGPETPAILGFEFNNSIIDLAHVGDVITSSSIQETYFPFAWRQPRSRARARCFMGSIMSLIFNLDENFLIIL